MTDIDEKLDKISAFGYHLTTCIRDCDLYVFNEMAINRSNGSPWRARIGFSLRAVVC